MRMDAEYDQDEMKPRKACDASFCVYFLFLFLPIITMVLLQIIPWHQNNSECDPHRAKLVWEYTSTEHHSETADEVVSPTAAAVWHNGKCTCIAEFPLYMSILAGFEILVFLYLCVSDPMKHPPYITIMTACKSSWSWRLVGIVVVNISYLTLTGLAFSAQIQSNMWCGFWLYGWSIFSCAGRLILVVASNIIHPMPQRERVVSIQYGNLYTAVHTQQAIAL